MSRALLLFLHSILCNFAISPDFLATYFHPDVGDKEVSRQGGQDRHYADTRSEADLKREVRAHSAGLGGVRHWAGRQPRFTTAIGEDKMRGQIEKRESIKINDKKVMNEIQIVLRLRLAVVMSMYVSRDSTYTET